MNRYGRIAQQHWSRHLPQTTAALSEPDTFYTQLGLKVADEIDLLASQLEGDDPPGEDYLSKLGRLRAARFTAEETVLRQRVLPAENETDDPTSDPQNATDSDRDGWLPTTVDPTHPGWAAKLDYQQHLSG